MKPKATSTRFEKLFAGYEANSPRNMRLTAHEKRSNLRNYLQDMRLIAHEKRSNLQELFAGYEANSP